MKNFQLTHIFCVMNRPDSNRRLKAAYSNISLTLTFVKLLNAQWLSIFLSLSKFLILYNIHLEMMPLNYELCVQCSSTKMLFVSSFILVPHLNVSKSNCWYYYNVSFRLRLHTTYFRRRITAKSAPKPKMNGMFRKDLYGCCMFFPKKKWATIYED